MVKWNQIKRLIVRSTAICLVVAGLIGEQGTAWASRRVRFNPPGGGAPKETKGGASRGDIACVSNPGRETPQLILLTPGRSNFGLTTRAYPTFLVYVPPTSAKEAFFSLKDAKGKSHYRQRFSVPSKGGILLISLPTSVAPLEINQSYEWGVVLLCGGKLRADSPFASGWIQRIQLAPKIMHKLENQPKLEQAAIYGESGIWYDMLSNLASLKQQQPQDRAITETWSQVLTSVGLARVTSVSLVE